ncbi:hypothetical protein C5469_16060 [Photorhabdus cinerea]|uniref:Uncharacterized protein n=1 Tax=Photorhabdus cinerea TaxID=471575 RepID=A0A7X5TII1_9GAMM|nr:hypothetical protein [Photorhabdus cinerea]
MIVYIPVIFQVASLLAALAYPGHIVSYAPGNSFPCRRIATITSTTKSNAGSLLFQHIFR